MWIQILITRRYLIHSEVRILQNWTVRENYTHKQKLAIEFLLWSDVEFKPILLLTCHDWKLFLDDITSQSSQTSLNNLSQMFWDETQNVSSGSSRVGTSLYQTASAKVL